MKPVFHIRMLLSFFGVVISLTSCLNMEGNGGGYSGGKTQDPLPVNPVLIPSGTYFRFRADDPNCVDAKGISHSGSLALAPAGYLYKSDSCQTVSQAIPASGVRIFIYNPDFIIFNNQIFTVPRLDAEGRLVKKYSKAFCVLRFTQRNISEYGKTLAAQFSGSAFEMHERNFTPSPMGGNTYTADYFNVTETLTSTLLTYQAPTLSLAINLALSAGLGFGNHTGVATRIATIEPAWECVLDQ